MSSRALKIALYSSVLNLLFVPLQSMVARLFGYAAIIFFVLYMVYPVLRNGKLFVDKTVLFFVLSIVISFAASLKSLQLDSIGTILDNTIVVVSFIVFYCALSHPAEENVTVYLEDIFIANYILCGIFILYAFGPFSFKYQVINEYGELLFTMGLGNPNAVSMCVMFSMIVLLLQISILKKRLQKVLHILLFVVLLCILYLLSSRTVFFCVLLIVAFYLFKSTKIAKLLSYGVVFAPAIMLFLQMNLVNTEQGIQILGKAINTGRPEMYISYLGIIKNNPAMLIWGNLCKYNFLNAHNGVLTLLISLGGIGVILYFIFWNKQLKILRTACVEKHQMVAFFAIIAFVIHASAESMAVIGTIPYSIFVVIIMRIAKGEIKRRHDGITENRA